MNEQFDGLPASSITCTSTLVSPIGNTLPGALLYIILKNDAPLSLTFAAKLTLGSFVVMSAGHSTLAAYLSRILTSKVHYRLIFETLLDPFTVTLVF